jgi:hypothetical protein
MKQKLVSIILISAATVFIAGCPHQALVYNVENTTVIAGEENYTLEDVEKAIIRAGAALGWDMEPVGPGRIEGTLFLRSHMAKVDIPYTKESYSILYKDSSNLRYDGEKIHSNYNGWIQNLDRGIKAQMNTL